MKFLMKQYTANSVASLRPRSGLILGSATAGEAASAGRARTSGVAALMAGAPRGRGPDACGAIVTAGYAGSAVPAVPRITPPALPAQRHAAPLAPSPERANVTRVRRAADTDRQADTTTEYRSRSRACALHHRHYGRCRLTRPAWGIPSKSRERTRGRLGTCKRTSWV